MHQLTIAMPDGPAPAYLWDRPGPPVLALMDGLGMRPAIREVGAQIAAAGYRVLMPDLFYRLGAYTPPEPRALFADPAVLKAWFARVSPVATGEALLGDLAVYLDVLGGTKVGAVGYCMGGRLAVVAAAHFPTRVAAAAAYHPGGLVTDKPDSPHLLAPRIRARLYLGRAQDDTNFDDAHHATLAAALTAARVDHQIDPRPARHGWVPSDTPVHDPAEAAHHLVTLDALFRATLT